MWPRRRRRNVLSGAIIEVPEIFGQTGEARPGMATKCRETSVAVLSGPAHFGLRARQLFVRIPKRVGKFRVGPGQWWRNLHKVAPPLPLFQPLALGIRAP